MRAIALKRGALSAIMVAGVLCVQGCAAAGLTLFGAGAGVSAGTGTGYTLDSIVYKTFTVPLAGLSQATVMTLRRMDIALVDTKVTETGQTLVAQAGDRAVEIELDQLTARTTRMRVVAKKNWFVRDRATATEIILQTDCMLSDNPELAAAAPRPLASGARKPSR